MTIFDTMFKTQPQVKTYQVTSKAGNTKIIAARTESDAFQKAYEFAGSDLIDSWEELS